MRAQLRFQFQEAQSVRIQSVRNHYDWVGRSLIFYFSSIGIPNAALRYGRRPLREGNALRSPNTYKNQVAIFRTEELGAGDRTQCYDDKCSWLIIRLSLAAHGYLIFNLMPADRRPPGMARPPPAF